MIGLDFWYLQINEDGCISLPSLEDILDSWACRSSDKVEGVKESEYQKYGWDDDESYNVEFYPEIISL